MKAWHITVAAAVMGSVSSGAALAACDSFSGNIPIDARHFEYGDINGDGKVDTGDMVVGRDMLFDNDGKEIGRLFATVTINQVDDSGGATKFCDAQVYALPNGGIFTFGEIDRGRVEVHEFGIVQGQQFEANDAADHRRHRRLRQGERDDRHVLQGRGRQSRRQRELQIERLSSIGPISRSMIADRRPSGSPHREAVGERSSDAPRRRRTGSVSRVLSATNSLGSLAAG